MLGGGGRRWAAAEGRRKLARDGDGVLGMASTTAVHCRLCPPSQAEVAGPAAAASAPHGNAGAPTAHPRLARAAGCSVLLQPRARGAPPRLESVALLPNRLPAPPPGHGGMSTPRRLRGRKLTPTRDATTTGRIRQEGRVSGRAPGGCPALLAGPPAPGGSTAAVQPGAWLRRGRGLGCGARQRAGQLPGCHWPYLGSAASQLVAQDHAGWQVVAQPYTAAVADGMRHRRDNRHAWRRRGAAAERSAAVKAGRCTRHAAIDDRDFVALSEGTRRGPAPAHSNFGTRQHPHGAWSRRAVACVGGLDGVDRAARRAGYAHQPGGPPPAACRRCSHPLADGCVPLLTRL